MVHISEISNSYVSDINEFLKDGQEVRVKIIGIDEKGRINLSIKKAQPRPAEPVREVPERTAPKTLSFEEMMSKFKQESDDKLSGFKMKETNRRSPYTKHSTKYSRIKSSVLKVQSFYVLIFTVLHIYLKRKSFFRRL